MLLFELGLTTVHESFHHIAHHVPRHKGSVFFQVVGVADPRKFARTKLQQQHNVVTENTFEGECQKKTKPSQSVYDGPPPRVRIVSVFELDWRGVVQREKFADAVVICTPDRLHKVNELLNARQSLNNPPPPPQNNQFLLIE